MSTETPPLSRLFHHRWSVPVLAELGRGNGGRFVNLSRRLGIGRESLRRTLDWLVEQGLVARIQLMFALDALQAEHVGLNKWSMPIVAALDDIGDGRFGQLRHRLPPISPRALTLALKALSDAGLVERRVVASFPPSTLYRLSRRARPIRPPLRRMAVA
jgi:DNA-binding HxlR family transcriptional regulator